MSYTTFTQDDLLTRVPSVSRGTRYPLSHYLFFSHLSLSHCAFLANVSGQIELMSYAQAIRGLHWQHAIQAELKALQHNHIWILIPLPTSHKPIGSKWVHKIKYNSNSTIE